MHSCVQHCRAKQLAFAVTAPMPLKFAEFSPKFDYRVARLAARRRRSWKSCCQCGFSNCNFRSLHDDDNE